MRLNDHDTISMTTSVQGIFDERSILQGLQVSIYVSLQLQQVEIEPKMDTFEI